MKCSHSSSPQEGWVYGDFRKLNKLTEIDQYNIPLVTEIIERVGNSHVLSKFDIAKGFTRLCCAAEN